MIQKKKFSDAIAANISVVGELLPIVSPENNGLANKKYSHFYKNSDNSSLLIKICKISKGGFSGRISLLFGRSEEAQTNSLFNIYVNSWSTKEYEATINIIREHGSHSNIKFYKDATNLYAYCGDTYHFFSIHVEEMLMGEPDFTVVPDYDISNFTEILIQS